jgi:hypothetical protein
MFAAEAEAPEISHPHREPAASANFQPPSPDGTFASKPLAGMRPARYETATSDQARGAGAPTGQQPEPLAFHV